MSAGTHLPRPSSDVAFTPSVKAVQTQRGSRAAYAKLEARGGFRTAIDERLVEAIAAADSAYLVTASADGQPYAQHRGGPRGFIRVMDEHTIGFADYAGNRQYISTGNLAENPKAFLFLMDYARQQRVKVWGRAHVVEDHEIVATLSSEDVRPSPGAAILFEVEAWDTNCPKYIPQKFDAADTAAALEARDRRIAFLEAEILALKTDRPTPT